MTSFKDRKRIHSFDEEYQKSSALFGHPYQELQDYFKNHSKGKVLDVGCGQGRDALFLASLENNVTAIDTSPVGVSQMVASNKDITGIVADVTTYTPEGMFDVLLFNMILHTFEEHQRTEILKRYSKHLTNNGIICIVFPDDFNATSFLEIFNSFSDAELVDEITVRDVPQVSGDKGGYIFTMIIITLKNKGSIKEV